MNQMMMNSMQNMPANNISDMMLAINPNQTEQQPQQLIQFADQCNTQNSNICQKCSIFDASSSSEKANEAQSYSDSACSAFQYCSGLSMIRQSSEETEKLESEKQELISKSSSSSSCSKEKESELSSFYDSSEDSLSQDDQNGKKYCQYCSSSSYRYSNNNPNNNSNNCILSSNNCILSSNFNLNTTPSSSSCLCRRSFCGGFRGFRGGYCQGGCCGCGLNILSASSSALSASSSASSSITEDLSFDNNISREEAIQPCLQGSVRLILSSGPRVGLYQSENEEEWNEFVKSLLAYFGGRAGSRAKVVEEIKAMMELHKEELADLLKDLGLSYGKCNIKEIIAKTDSYVPCASKRELEGAEALYRKNEQNLTELRIEGSKVRLSILQGLQKSGKYAEPSILEERVMKIIESRISELKVLEKKIDVLRKRVLADVKYIRLLRLKTLLKECFEKWEEADKNAGKETQLNGKKLEDLLMEEDNKYIDIIIKRIGESRTTTNIHHNLLWEGVDGEVDLAITDLNNSRILGLVEIKARLFDISAAFRQSGPLRLKSKNRLIVNSKLVDVPLNVPLFVVTTLPSYSFQLGFESKLKDSLNKFFAVNEPHLIDYSEVYRSLKPAYSNLYSPLQWFDLYASKHLIIIDQQNNDQLQNDCEIKVHQQQQQHHHLCFDHRNNSVQKMQFEYAKELENDYHGQDYHNMSVETDDDHHDSRDSSLQLRDQHILCSHRLSSPILSSQPSTNQMSDEEESEEDFQEDDSQYTKISKFSYSEDNSTLYCKYGQIKMFSLVSSTVDNVSTWQGQPQPWPQPQPQPQELPQQNQQQQQQQQELLQNEQQQLQQQRQQEQVSQTQSKLQLQEQQQQGENMIELICERSKLCNKLISKTLKKPKDERKQKEEPREQKEECREPVKKIQKVNIKGALRQMFKGQQCQARLKNSSTRQPYDDKIKNPQTQQMC